MLFYIKFTMAFPSRCAFVVAVGQCGFSFALADSSVGGSVILSCHLEMGRAILDHIFVSTVVLVIAGMVILMPEKAASAVLVRVLRSSFSPRSLSPLALVFNTDCRRYGQLSRPGVRALILILVTRL